MRPRLARRSALCLHSDEGQDGASLPMNIVAVIGILVTLVTAIPVQVQLRRQPRGLFVLFFAEMW